MTESGVWGTDIEIVAISCILDSDVYIATEQYDAKNLWTRTIWNRYSGCIDNPRKPPQVALYISNRNHDHYEPVTRLMNSEYDSVMNSKYLNYRLTVIYQLEIVSSLFKIQNYLHQISHYI